MKLTLYKNCKLNNSYKNVFSFGTYNNSKLIDLYLNNLTKSRVIEIDYVYQKRVDSIPVDLVELNGYGDIYQYNYCKITSDDGTFLRYCFITDIVYQNDIVNLVYEEDVWHSYGSTMNITKSFLINNRLADKPNFYNNALKTLPLEYENNNKIKIVRTYSPVTELYNIIIEAQIYNGTKVGEVNERTTYVSLVDIKVGNDYVKEVSLEDAQFYSQKLITSQSLKCIDNDNSLQTKYYININEIYIVPVHFNLESYFYSSGTSGTNKFILIGTSAFWIDPTITCDCYYSQTSTSNSLSFLREFTVSNNFKIKSIGTFNTQIPIKPNGNDFKISLYTFITQSDFKLFMSFNNQFIEITNDFKYTCPFVAVNGEENNMLKMNRTLNNLKDILGIAYTTAIVSNVSKIPMGMTEDVNTRALALPQYVNMGGLYVEGVPMARSMKYKTERNTNIETPNSSFILDLIKNNAPFYSSSSSILAESNGIECAKYGICYYEIENPINEYLITDLINENGYNVYEIISNFDITGIMGDSNREITLQMISSYKYNYIRFGFLNVYGSFPRSIAKQLENILLNGTKVWFNYFQSEIN